MSQQHPSPSEILPVEDLVDDVCLRLSIEYLNEPITVAPQLLVSTLSECHNSIIGKGAIRSKHCDDKEMELKETRQIKLVGPCLGAELFNLESWPLYQIAVRSSMPETGELKASMAVHTKDRTNPPFSSMTCRRGGGVGGDQFQNGLSMSSNVQKNLLYFVIFIIRSNELVISSLNRLILQRALGQVEQITDATQRALTASMLDSGSFVLYDSNFYNVWASFDYPTGTLLVGQKLVQNASLYSITSETNYSTGRFKLGMQRNGNLVAYPLRNFVTNGYSYWSTLTADAGYIDVSLNLDEDGRLYLRNSSGISVKNLTMGGFPADKTFVYRTTFDVDGILRLYLHQIGMNGSSNSSVTLANVAWEDGDYEFWKFVSEEVCLQACLEDCNCVVAMYRNQTCFKQKLPMRYGKKNASGETRTLVKIRSGSSSVDPSPDGVVVINKLTKRLGKEFLIAGLVISRNASPSDFVDEINLRSFAYNELVEATDNFKEELGKGASGRVYKGSLTNNGGREIAVKRVEKVVEEGEREFRNEMKVIGRTHHKNLVRLLGFCSEGSKRLLVYEYMKNGSLGALLYKAKTCRGWDERVRISLEIARGILYLHEEWETRIIHCDIKPHNILMDQSWSARISDFGLSKLLNPDQTRTYTTPRGTRGYEAPEWHKNTPITVKADVYGYGILLLEIICCRKNIDMSLVDEEIVLMDWVYSCYDTGELGKVVGGEEVEEEALERMVKVGLWCVQTEPALRPSMKKVVLMLEETDDTAASTIFFC
ncbi:hypothetical protein HHK36_004230 [Tetracentron sinense]|uniref:non-specific serine/threonine protein kinase n=1 Tax=Tetracentron sinense TaxID=13715 RepID=A0A834ZSH8_TETSI|nr:hypothetical protein HHK36_004230 [Tetracentron sinense]